MIKIKLSEALKKVREKDDYKKLVEEMNLVSVIIDQDITDGNEKEYVTIVMRRMLEERLYDVITREERELLKGESSVPMVNFSISPSE